MRIISRPRLKQFCTDHPDAKAEDLLNERYHVVRHANWENFASVRATYNSTDQVGHLTVFDAGGNKFRIITAIDYVHGIVYLREVLTHKEYDQGHWKNDEFGKRGWKPRQEPPATRSAARRKKRKS
jgi:mRNA interferase HigB